MTIPVAGIGASAGGLEACKLLLAHLPSNAGLAIVLVQHLDPKHPSNLTEILARAGSIPVRQAADGMALEPNHMYVVPPDAELEIVNKALRITPRVATVSGPRMPIDRFLRSLAQDCGSRAIGVILSGAGADGAAGLDAVKATGGVTLAQDPSTAKFDSMPQTAIGRGCVDFVLSPEAIAAELTKLGHHPYITEDEDAGWLERDAEDQFGPILLLLRDAADVDFALYREKTIQRRIMRRLALCNFDSLEEYRKLVERDSRELSALHRDLLIGVTCFFRDPESFECLKTVVFPRLVQDRPAANPIRIWVPGCATGEEAYSIAIALQEYCIEANHGYPVNIFASDISATAIDRARSGKYPAAIASDVSPERLSRCFTKVADGYQIGKVLREMFVFSRHDLIQDPPFSKLDLISCRNVPTFLGSVRNNIVARFHYALNPGGFLVLGPSQAEPGPLFSKVEGARSVYSKNETVGRRGPLYAGALSPSPTIGAYNSGARVPADDFFSPENLQKEVERTLVAGYNGTGVVVDARLQVLEIRGQAAPYLALPPGKISLNFLKLIPQTRLFLEVEKLVREVRRSGQAARKDRVRYLRDGVAGEVNVEAIPLGATAMHALLVLFEPTPGATAVQQDPDSDPRDSLIATLKRDVSDARQCLSSIIEDHRLTEKATRNTAADAISANEELQILNEELETAKEELQSINEELTTVNQELLSNNLALAEARDFAMLVIETVAAPIVVLDPDLRITTANQSFYSAFRIPRHEAEGQLLYTVSSGCWDIPRLRDMLERVLPDHKTVLDFEIEQDFPGIGHRLLVLNARQLDGAQKIVLGIDDVTARDLRLAAIVESSDDAIFAKTLDGTIVSWNSGAENIYGYSANEIIGRPITTLAPEGQEAETVAIMERIQRGEKLRHFETKRRRKDGEIIDVSATISPIHGRNGEITGASIVARDITELKRREQESLAKQKLESVGTLAGGIAHDFNNLLGGVLAHAELALGELASGSPPKEELERIRAVAIRGAEIVRQLMIFAGQENEAPELVDVSQIVEDMVELLKVAVSKHAAVETDLGEDLPPVQANPAQIRQVVMNLITNASEAIGNRDGVVRVTTGQVTVNRESPGAMSEFLPEGDYLQLEVSDTGRGMIPEVQARVFDPFFTTKQPGHGLGLAVVQGIVRSLRGSIRVASAPGNGTTFKILLPCAEHRVPATPGKLASAEEEELLTRHATILIVEDEDSLRRPLSTMLRNRNLSVLEARDGSAALDLIRTSHDHIDVLFLDISLPGISSREVFEEARRLRPDVAVVVTSAYSEEMAAATLGADGERFIRKPYRLDHLMNLIRQVLSY